MSGPKTSRYSLTAEQRRILEEQRKIKIEREILAKQMGETRSVISEADRIIAQSASFYAETGADSSALTQAKAMRRTAAEALAQASSVGDRTGAAHLREVNKNLRAVTQKLVSATNAAKSERASADKAFRADVASRIDEGFNALYDSLGGKYAVGRSSIRKTIRSELEEIAALPLTDGQRSRIESIQKQFAEIEDPDFLKNFHAMTVMPFAKKVRAYHEAYALYGEEYERKRFTYESNAQNLGIAVECVPFSPDAIAVLDSKIKETETAIAYRDEQAYISSCVDEAMREMGYSVVGSRDVVRRSGKHFHNELYLFGEGAAVNVTYSGDGQITMELGGIDREDRIPTEAESKSLASDMQTFCGDYSEIEKILRKKGIVMRKISVLPPDVQYAQIINVSDYDMSADVAEYEAKSSKSHTTASKVQRMGE